MLSRRQALKLSLGSFVAALSLGPRAVAAIPADVDAPAVELLPDGIAPIPFRELRAFVYCAAFDTGREGYAAITVTTDEHGATRCTVRDMNHNDIDVDLTLQAVADFFLAILQTAAA